MKNEKRIRKQIRTVYVLRGLLAGVLLSIALAGMFMYLKMFLYNTREILIIMAVFILLCIVLFFLFSFLKSSKVLKPIRMKDKMYSGVSFNDECFAEAGESRDFWIGEDWLVWHRDLKIRAWHREELAGAQRIGSKAVGNVAGMMRITFANGRTEDFTYRLGEPDAAEVINDWLNPYVPEEEACFCPQCGAQVNPGAGFCGNCGAELRNI